MSFCGWCQKQTMDLRIWTDFEVCVDCLATLPEMLGEASSDDDDVEPSDASWIFDDDPDDDAVVFTKLIDIRNLPEWIPSHVNCGRQLDDDEADGSWDNAVRAFEDTRE